MNYYKNGNSVISTFGTLDLPEITKEEFDAEVQRIEIKAPKRAEAAERHRPLTESEAVSMLLRQNIQSIAVTDEQAVRMTAFYPTFDECKGERVKQGFKFSHEGVLYRTVQPDMEIMAIYPPGPGTESLYEIIPELFAGDEYDPIPYSGNMALETGKYYAEDGVMYRCIRPSGIPVHDPLSRLATDAGGKYVEVV